MIGRDYIVPTTRGEILWRPESWGVVLTEKIYQQFGDPIVQIIRLPWSTFTQIEETA